MSESVNLFPETSVQEQVNKIFEEAKQHCEKHQIIFTDYHAQMVVDVMRKMIHLMDTSNPLRRGDGGVWV